MKLNEKTTITGSKVLLVPYGRHHVPKYHEWMKSEELQQLTASEPLSLEEEFNMQRTWREDEDKCTFILLEKTRCGAVTTGQSGQEQVEIDSMIGDVNLFLDQTRHVAEVEIMIAETRARGQGVGKEALSSMLRYGMEVLAIEKFEAKIGLQNQPSINLFSKLGFTETSRSDVFKEVTMEMESNDQARQCIWSLTSHFEIQEYHHAS